MFTLGSHSSSAQRSTPGRSGVSICTFVPVKRVKLVVNWLHFRFTQLIGPEEHSWMLGCQCLYFCTSKASKLRRSWTLRCHFLYFCTSKSSKLISKRSTWVLFRHTFQLFQSVYFCTSKASKLSSKLSAWVLFRHTFEPFPKRAEIAPHHQQTSIVLSCRGTCTRPSAPSVRGLELLAYEALSY